ncbi:MAG: NAD(P)/FAD-dependent oxidoreductase [Armatimonadetes bacterium]|jgi:protoporphyrinogen oxidase|nr:NAD(P)/FAD-dependent oxidoreductase [Armatimonadota bacterium]MDI9601365.1 NAD(P)/FAD-dependent oxidoreductase [Acidobacteriota bacterium]NLN90266.1 NAD(P)/FAD-dependent oxidoreductase [candidate division WS1 bacterium]
MERVAIIMGAGPAGLTACYELGKESFRALCLERDGIVGGISRTDEYKGYRFDLGGHRFFTKCAEVDEFWTEILGPEMLDRPRMSRIFYNGRFFDYPLKPANALRNLGMGTSLLCLASYLRWKALPYRMEESFEHWVTNRFGKRLYEIFFKTYTEKVWGMPCREISADWAAQRIKGLSLWGAVRDALFHRPGDTSITTLIDRFRYPRLGPGMMWERAADLATQRGQQVVTHQEVREVHHEGGRVRMVAAFDELGGRTEYEGTDVISSLALNDLVAAMVPAAPPEVVAAARAMKHRDFLTVGLIVSSAELFPDNWIYIHSPEVRLGRIQNFKNWSPEMVPDPAMSCLGLEYFVFEGDALWSASDDYLIELGASECDRLGLARKSDVTDGVVVRVRKAYPVYDDGYADRVGLIRSWLAEACSNLQCVGRNGQHRYNNSDHSSMTAMLAVRNLLGESHDIWSVNVDQEYHEEARTGDRATPRRL